MELNFSLKRLLILIACCVVFAGLGGFSPPAVDPAAFQAHRMTRAWLYCVVLFMAGAGCVSLVDHRVGSIEPTNLRPAYVILGLLLMVASLFWLHTLQQSVGVHP